MIASLALPALFIASGLFALGVLAMSWQAYAREMLVIRQELGRSETYRAFPARITTVDVRAFGGSVGRRPVRRIQPAVFGPATRVQPGLRAAA